MVNDKGVMSSEGFKGTTHVQCYGFSNLHGSWTVVYTGNISVGV